MAKVKSDMGAGSGEKAKKAGLERASRRGFARELGASLGVIALLAGLSFVLLGAFEGEREERDEGLTFLNPQLVTHEEAPGFTLTDRDGRERSLSELRGRPVVLNLWSVDCPPCVRELPSLEWLAGQGRERGSFTVLTISVDPSWAEVGPLFPDGTEMTVLFDPERAVVTQLYGTERFPETFIIDREGFIRARFDGQRDWSRPEVVELIERY
jgi:peroxiredoxin